MGVLKVDMLCSLVRKKEENFHYIYQCFSLFLTKFRFFCWTKLVVSIFILKLWTLSSVESFTLRCTSVQIYTNLCSSYYRYYEALDFIVIRFLGSENSTEHQNCTSFGLSPSSIFSSIKLHNLSKSIQFYDRLSQTSTLFQGPEVRILIQLPYLTISKTPTRAWKFIYIFLKVVSSVFRGSLWDLLKRRSTTTPRSTTATFRHSHAIK